jgi:hypothetical protein
MAGARRIRETGRNALTIAGARRREADLACAGANRDDWLDFERARVSRPE